MPHHPTGDPEALMHVAPAGQVDGWLGSQVGRHPYLNAGAETQTWNLRHGTLDPHVAPLAAPGTQPNGPAVLVP